MESIISTFHIDWKIIIAQAINFGVVFVVLYIFALKPLHRLMKERAFKIKQGIDDATSNAKILEETRVQYEEIIAKARIESDKIFQQGKKEAEVKKVKMLEDTKTEVAMLIEKGKQNLVAEKNKMLEEVKEDIVLLAMKATEKLINSKADLNNLK